MRVPPIGFNPLTRILHRSKLCFNLQTGFTLVELMIVVAIIAILAAVGGISLTGQLPKYRLRGDARTIASSLMLARMNATQSGVDYAIRFELGNPQHYVLERRNANNANAWAEQSYRRDLSTGIRIANIDGGTPVDADTVRMIYRPNGSFNAAQGEIHLGIGSATGYRIILTPTTGRIQTIKE